MVIFLFDGTFAYCDIFPYIYSDILRYEQYRNEHESF